MELSVKQIDGVTIVEPRGRLDTSAAPQFQEQFVNPPKPKSDATQPKP